MQRLVVPFLLCFFFSLFGNVHPQPGQIAIRGEWIYFKPLLDTNYFVIKGESGFSDPTHGSRINNNLQYSSGYRVEGIYGFCNSCSDIRFRWTQLNTSHTKSYSATFTDETLFYPTEGAARLGIPAIAIGSVDSKIKFRYKAADLLFTHRLYRCCPIEFFAQVGLEYAQFKVNKTINEHVFIPEIAPAQTEAFDFIKNNAYFSGVGPVVGFNFQYAFSNCCIPACLQSLCFVTDVIGGLLVSDSHVNFSSNLIENEVPTSSDVKDKNLTRIVPMFDIRLALNYQHWFRCFGLNIEAGYEFLTYLRPISILRFDNPDFVGYSTNQFSDIGMYGPFLALSVIF